MEAILNCKPEDLEDYYGVLGCDELSSKPEKKRFAFDVFAPEISLDQERACDAISKRAEVTEQILNEYKIRALGCHPDKHLDNPAAVADFQKLHEAKEVLCNETKRKNYDLWKRSGVTMSYQDWKSLNDSVQTSMHWAVRNKKEPMLEASEAEVPVDSWKDNLHSEQEASGDSMPSQSDYCHRRFRWAADSPSSLLQRFRNYEI